LLDSDFDIDRNPVVAAFAPPRLARTCPNGNVSSSCTAITFANRHLEELGPRHHRRRRQVM